MITDRWLARTHSPHGHRLTGCPSLPAAFPVCSRHWCAYCWQSTIYIQRGQLRGYFCWNHG